MDNLARTLAYECDAETLRAVQAAITMQIRRLDMTSAPRAAEDARRLRAIRHAFGHACDIQERWSA